MKRLATLAAASLLWLLTTTAFAQRELKDIPDPDPELERQTFKVADGFEVNLFAADPLIAKPIHMNFDPQGRLWIASSEVYPQIKPGAAATDRILVIEDKDGDGKADKTTVFKDGLLIPTGVAPGDGGAYVANSTELLHLKDTDGDGKADEERVVLSGFGTEDTHHILHTLRWGPDGMLYMNQSIYIHSHIETPWGVRRLNAGGIWQFRPENMKLEVFARGWVNTWGHIFDQYGQSFATDGAGGEGINYVIPGAAYPTATGVPKIFKGLNPGSPKYCGLEILSGRHLPDDWQGNLITNDFRGHRVCRFVLTDNGSGYAAKEQVELIKTSHVAFRPIDVQMGPDGAIYIADWYNPIIQHGEVDFRDPRRDHVHGRIWRVTRKDRPVVARPTLVDASTPELLDQLKSPEGWTRQQAKRVLKERGAAAVISHLAAWTKKLDADDPLFERNKLEALWTYQSLETANAELLNDLLRAKQAEVRAGAARVLQHWYDRVPGGLDHLARLVHDEHARVRLEAVRILGNVAGPRGVELAMQAISHPLDMFLDYALWLTAWENREQWLPLAESGQLTFGNNVDQMTYALKTVGSPAVVPRLLSLLEAGGLTGPQLPDSLSQIANLGSPDDLRRIYVHALKSNNTALQTQTLQALVANSKQRGVLPAGDLNGVVQLLNEKQPLAVRAAAAEAVGEWKLEAQFGALLALANKADEDVQLRKSALNGIARMKTADSINQLETLSRGDAPFEVREAAAIGAASLQTKRGAAAAAGLLAKAAAGADPTALINAFLGLKDGPAELTAALANQKINGDVAKLALRSVEASGRKLPELTDALTKAGGVQAGPKSLSPAEMTALLTELKDKGDAARGEKIFRRESTACLKCHAIGGAGGRVGPDLASLGASAQPDYVFDSLVEPNKKVKEGFNTLIIITKDGRSVSGVKVRQTDKDLVLRNADDKEINVPLAEIDEQADGASLMPTGVTDKLTRQEFVDLARFLSELGKVGGEYQLGRERVVRRWLAMQPTNEGITLLRRTRIGSAATEDPALLFGPAYSSVKGTLPLEDLATVPFYGPFKDLPDGVHIVRFEFDVSTSGEAIINVGDPQGLTAWLDTEPLELKSDPISLTPGRHRVTLIINRAVRKTPLRVELQDPPTGAAQLQLVTGK